MYPKVSIFQRKQDNRWVGQIYFGPDAKPKYRTLYAKGEEEVKAKVNALLFEIKIGEYIPPNKDTLVSFLREYHKACLPNWESTTAELYKMYIDVHFEPYFKDMKITDVKTLTLDTFYNYKMETPREQKIMQGKITVTKKVPPLSVNTVNKLDKFLRTAFNYAIANDKIRKNPTDGVKLASKIKYRPTVYDQEKFLKLLESVRGKDEEIPVILGAGCGLRRGEMCGLRWKNVDFDKRTITIERTRVNFTKNIEKNPKNETSARTIIAPEYVVNTLLAYYKSKESPDLSENVITRWKPKSLSERFGDILKQHGLEHIRLHDLRHYNAVIMMTNGTPDRVAAERLGHSNVTTLREVYQHVLKDMDKEAAEKINNSIIMDKPKELTKEERRARFKIM